MKTQDTDISVTCSDCGYTHLFPINCDLDWKEHTEYMAEFQCDHCEPEIEIPLNFNWDCLPGWSCYQVEFYQDDGWFYWSKRESGVMDRELINEAYYPKPPFPPGYEDGRVFERPKRGEWVLDEETPEATEEKICIRRYAGINNFGDRLFTNCDDRLKHKSNGYACLVCGGKVVEKEVNG